MPNPSRFAAVDTDVLLSLAAGDERCQGAIDVLSKAGFYFLVTETTLQELSDILQKDADSEIRQAAQQTLQQLTNFGFITSSLDAVKLGVAEQIAKRIMEKCIPDCEINDGLAITEAAYNNCKILVSQRPSLLIPERLAVMAVLVDSDLPAVIVLSPSEILEVFNSQHE